MDKSKDLISGPGCDVFQKSGKDPCGVKLKGVDTNSIFCGGCSSSIHNKISGIPGSLKPDTSFRCKRCTGQARPIDGRLMTEVTMGREKFQVVPSFCYLSWGLFILRWWLWIRPYHKMPSQMGQVQRAPARSHLPPITSRGRVYNSFLRSAIHGSETWAQRHPICIAYNVMIETWFVGCAASPPKTKSAWSAPSHYLYQCYYFHLSIHILEMFVI